jgi:hypothetical protein
MEQNLIWQGEVNIMKLFFPKRTLKFYQDKLVIENNGQVEQQISKSDIKQITANAFELKDALLMGYKGLVIEYTSGNSIQKLKVMRKAQLIGYPDTVLTKDLYSAVAKFEGKAADHYSHLTFISPKVPFYLIVTTVSGVINGLLGVLVMAIFASIASYLIVKVAKTPTQKYLIAIAGVLAGWVTLFVIGFVIAAILIASEG